MAADSCCHADELSELLEPLAESGCGAAVVSEENENTFFLMCFFFFALLFDSLFIFPFFLQKYKVKNNLWRELVQLCNVALCVSSSVRENNSLGIGHNFLKF